MRSSRLVVTFAALVALSASACFSIAACAGPTCDCLGPPDSDFDADGKTDLIRSNATEIRIDLLDGKEIVAQGSFPNGGGLFALRAVGRLNADDNADFVSQGGGHARVTFVNAAGTGTLGTLFIADGGGSWQVVDAADVNGDGVDEIVFEGSGAAAGVVRIADIASGSPVFRYLATGGGIWSYAFSGDVNGDDSEDLLFRGTGAALGAVRANFAGGTATVRYYPQGGGAWTLRTMGDFDGNGTLDLADAPNPWNFGVNRIRLLDTDGNPTATGYVPNGGGFFALKATGDYTGDGRDDLAYDSPGTFLVVAMRGIAPGARYFLPNVEGTYTLRRLGDTNADGLDDLISTDADGDVRIQLTNVATTTTASTDTDSAAGGGRL